MMKILVFVLVALTAHLGVLQGQIRKANVKPNVILILADDLGYGEIGSNGQKKIKTPYLDRLAAESIQFKQFYTGTPVCAPARANLLTGLHAGHAQIRGNLGLTPYQENESEPGSFPLKAGTFTLGTLFSSAGYATAVVGKWGLGNYDNDGDPLKQGFDYFYGYYDQRQAHNYYPTHLWENGDVDSLDNPVIDVHPPKGNTRNPDDFVGKTYVIDKMMEKAGQFIEKNKERPFFLYLPLTLPHGVLQRPRNGIEYYKEFFNEQPGQKNEITDYPKATYATMISYLDAQIGVIQKILSANGLSENTILIFTSDNGPASGGDLTFFNSTAGLRGAKQDVYEGGIRVPFLLKWPAVVRKSSVSNCPAVAYDLFATFADLLQVSGPETDGISLLGLLRGDTQKVDRHFLYWEYPANTGQLAVRIGDFKGVKTQLKANPQAPWQLYDLSTDPTERQDISAKHLKILKTLDRIVQKEHQTPQLKEWDIFPKEKGVIKKDKKQ